MMHTELKEIGESSNWGARQKQESRTNELTGIARRFWVCRNTGTEERIKKVAEAAGSANNQEKEEDWDADVTPPLCPPSLEWKDMVSQLNQDPKAESIANSGHGTTAMEEDVKLNAVKEKLIEDDTSCAALDNSSRPDDLTWNADIPYFEFTDDSAMACKTPAASLTPVVAPAGDAVLSPHESPGSKKQCVHETMAERLLQSASMVIMEPDYKDTPLAGYKRPDLSEVIPWICFKAQNMMEPPWQTEMASIKQDDDVRYIAAMFVWF